MLLSRHYLCPSTGFTEMDLLSAKSSIDGLLAVAAHVAAILGSELSPQGLQNQPRAASRLLDEVHRSQQVLASLLYFFIDPASVSADRSSLVQLEQLIAVLADGVFVFADLEAIVTPWRISRDSIPLQEGLHWAGREDSIATTLPRLRSFRMSISLVLSIFQWLVTSDVRSHIPAG